jgi:hypothetical protein
VIPIRVATILFFAVLQVACSRPSDSSSATSARKNAENSAPATKGISEEQARALLMSKLRAHKVADLNCLGFQNENTMSGESKAELWEFAAREQHDERCGGDPAVSHVRDRYKVSSSGEVWLYVVANDQYARL